MYLFNCTLGTRGANLFAKDCQGFTPYMVAIAKGQKDVLKIMLDPDSDVNKQKTASIALWAMENDHVTFLQVCYCTKCGIAIINLITNTYNVHSYVYVTFRGKTGLVRTW